MTHRHTLAPAWLLAALLAASAAQAQNTPAAPAGSTDQERCYGVALKGEPVCQAGAAEPCTSMAASDHQGDVWKFVPKGSCEQTPSTTSPTRFGQLQAYTAAGAKPMPPGGEPAPKGH